MYIMHCFKMEEENNRFCNQFIITLTTGGSCQYKKYCTGWFSFSFLFFFILKDSQALMDKIFMPSCGSFRPLHAFCILPLKIKLQHNTRKCIFITSDAPSLYLTRSWSSLFPCAIITVSPLLTSFSVSLLLLFLSFYQSITHSDSLCNMSSSKLNSTLLDLQPFPSSKWLTSVITLQPEWETQRRGREERGGRQRHDMREEETQV